MRFGKQLAEQAFNPDGPSFADGLRKARERIERERAAGASTGTPATGTTTEASSGPKKG
jgi:hypothetical protein